ncbi:MAG: hypothetical protein ACLUD0_12575 [Eubacterium ramulus]
MAAVGILKHISSLSKNAGGGCAFVRRSHGGQKSEQNGKCDQRGSAWLVPASGKTTMADIFAAAVSGRRHRAVSSCMGSRLSAQNPENVTIRSGSRFIRKSGETGLDAYLGTPQRN